MKVIFVAGPFRGDGSREAREGNLEKARQYIRRFVEKEIPYYSPHMNTSTTTIDFEGRDPFATALNHQFLDYCDALAVLPGWKDSSGTQEEITRAEEQGKRIFYLEEADAFEAMKKYLKD
ncbi:DUF1937 family protein [Candidatus Kaiserbacteria bacterium]|nr:DUF1937 family protein [Candidatus Kaiserbacteria bacterium]